MSLNEGSTLHRHPPPGPPQAGQTHRKTVLVQYPAHSAHRCLAEPRQPAAVSHIPARQRTLSDIWSFTDLPAIQSCRRGQWHNSPSSKGRSMSCGALFNWSLTHVCSLCRLACNDENPYKIACHRLLFIGTCNAAAEQRLPELHIIGCWWFSLLWSHAIKLGVWQQTAMLTTSI